MWLEPRMPIPHARPPVSRHLLGLGLLLVTMASGYAASLVYERPSVVVPVQESVAQGFEAEATQGDPWADALAQSARLNAVARRPAEFRDYSVTQNDDVRYFLDLFTRSRREVVETWMGRSGRYLGMIQEVFRSQGLPPALASTAMIESGFAPRAVSSARAKGLWQFMAPTARRYGLRVDRWVDERLDPEKSTVAAAAYLRDLYRQFGSWELAHAAYNAGEGKVIRAIRVTGSSNFWNLTRTKHLRRETREYVPAIQAATLIGRDPDQYGFAVGGDPWDDTERVSVPPSTDLRRLAADAGLSPEMLRGLNPTLVRGMTPPGTPWEIRVPRGTRISQGVPGGVIPRTSVGFSPRSISGESPASAARRRRSVEGGTDTRSVSSHGSPPTANPYWSGSRPMSVAAWMAGTYSRVSRRRCFVRVRFQKFDEPVTRIARITLPSPALYAACASSHEPNWRYRSRR